MPSVKKWTPSVEEVEARRGRAWADLGPEDRVRVWADRVRIVAKSMLGERITVWEDRSGPHHLGEAFEVLGWEGGSSDPLDELVSEVLVSLTPNSPDGLGNPLGYAEGGEHYGLIEVDPDEAMRYTQAYLRKRIRDVVEIARSERFKGVALAPHADDEYLRPGKFGPELVAVDGLDSLAGSSAPAAEDAALDGLSPYGLGMRWVPPTKRPGRLSVPRAVEEYKAARYADARDVFEVVNSAEAQLGRELTRDETTALVREAHKAIEWWRGHGRAFLADVFGVDPEEEDFERRLVCFPYHETNPETALARHRTRVVEEAFPLVDERRRAWESFRKAWTSAEREAIQRTGAAYVEASDALVEAWGRVFTREASTLPGLGLAEAERLYGRCDHCRPAERECPRAGCEVTFRPNHHAAKLCPEHRPKPRPKVIEARAEWV